MLRPRRSDVTSRHHLRQARWFEIRLCGAPTISTSCDTARSPPRRASRIRRRVGSPRTLKSLAEAPEAVSGCAGSSRNLARRLTPPLPPHERGSSGASAPWLLPLFAPQRSLKQQDILILFPRGTQDRKGHERRMSTPVPGVGVEPTRSVEQQGLGLPRLPVPPPGPGTS